MKERGFTLIEVVLSIAIIAAMFTTLGMVLTETTDRNLDLESSTVAVFLAREKMAEIMANDFDAVAAVPLTNIGGDFGYHAYRIDVDYVEAADLNLSVAGPTDYKRIVVSVAGLGNMVRLYGLKVSL